MLPHYHPVIVAGFQSVWFGVNIGSRLGWQIVFFSYLLRQKKANKYINFISDVLVPTEFKIYTRYIFLNAIFMVLWLIWVNVTHCQWASEILLVKNAYVASAREHDGWVCMIFAWDWPCVDAMILSDLMNEAARRHCVHVFPRRDLGYFMVVNSIWPGNP